MNSETNVSIEEGLKVFEVFKGSIHPAYARPTRCRSGVRSWLRTGDKGLSANGASVPEKPKLLRLQRTGVGGVVFGRWLSELFDAGRN